MPIATVAATLFAQLFHDARAARIVIHLSSCSVSCPKPGTVLRKQNPKSKPQRQAALSRQTAALARNAFHSTSRPTAVFFRARLVVAIAFQDFDEVQPQDP